MKQLLTVVLAFFAATANAGVIISSSTVNTSLGNGNSADLQGLEWLHFSETVGFSRSDVENNVGINYIADGWRYANRTETETLINSLWGGNYSGWAPDNYPGADWFINVFGGTRVGGAVFTSAWTNYHYNAFYFGADGDCVTGVLAAAWTCGGQSVRADDYNTGTLSGINKDTGQTETTYVLDTRTVEGVGWLGENWGGDFGLSNAQVTYQKTSGRSDFASLLVRTAVPVPATLALVALGLLGLRLNRRS